MWTFYDLLPQRGQKPLTLCLFELNSFRFFARFTKYFNKYSIYRGCALCAQCACVWLNMRDRVSLCQLYLIEKDARTFKEFNHYVKNMLEMDDGRHLYIQQQQQAFTFSPFIY